MRLLTLTTVALALLLTSSVASSYELRMQLKSGSADPATVNVGDSFTYEVFLDTEGSGDPINDPSDITLFSVSLTFNPNVVGYNRVLSDAEDYYPLYYPKFGVKPNIVAATWLKPVADPPNRWPVPPAGLRQINIDFLEANLATTVASATNLKIAELSFNAVGVGSGTPVFGFGNGGNIFNIQNGNVITGSVVTSIVTGGTITVPEPAAAAMALGALGAVGLLAQRRRRA